MSNKRKHQNDATVDVAMDIPMIYYRSTSVGIALVSTLNKMLDNNSITNEIASRILELYDEHFQSCLRQHTHIDRRLQKVHCNGVLENYNNYYNLWKIDASDTVIHTIDPNSVERADNNSNNRDSTPDRIDATTGSSIELAEASCSTPASNMLAIDNVTGFYDNRSNTCSGVSVDGVGEELLRFKKARFLFEK